MPTTTNGWPYPADTETVFNGDDAIKALADKLEVRVVNNISRRNLVYVTTNSAGGFTAPVGFTYSTGAVTFTVTDHEASATRILLLGVMNGTTSNSTIGGVARLHSGGALISTTFLLGWTALGRATGSLLRDGSESEAAAEVPVHPAWGTAEYPFPPPPLPDGWADGDPIPPPPPDWGEQFAEPPPGWTPEGAS